MTLITPIGPGRLRESQLAEWSTAINALIGSGWTDYSGTFTLTASSVNPTKGNSTYAAFYRRPNAGDLVHVRIYVLIGSTFVVGTGDYQFSLPVNAHAAEVTGGIGTCYYLDTSAGTNYIGVCRPTSASFVKLIVDRQANFLGAANPVTPATGDTYMIKYAYEAA